jgi:hypothetical protein
VWHIGEVRGLLVHTSGATTNTDHDYERREFLVWKYQIGCSSFQRAAGVVGIGLKFLVFLWQFPSRATSVIYGCPLGRIYPTFSRRQTLCISRPDRRSKWRQAVPQTPIGGIVDTFKGAMAAVERPNNEICGGCSARVRRGLPTVVSAQSHVLG